MSAPDSDPPGIPPPPPSVDPVARAQARQGERRGEEAYRLAVEAVSEAKALQKLLTRVDADMRELRENAQAAALTSARLQESMDKLEVDIGDLRGAVRDIQSAVISLVPSPRMPAVTTSMQPQARSKAAWASAATIVVAIGTAIAGIVSAFRGQPPPPGGLPPATGEPAKPMLPTNGGAPPPVPPGR